MQPEGSRLMCKGGKSGRIVTRMLISVNMNYFLAAINGIDNDHLFCAPNPSF